MSIERWAKARSILAIRLDGMGDVMMTTPALRALKHRHAGRQLTLLTSPAGAAAAKHVPGVDEVIVYPAPWMKAAPARHDTFADMAMVEHLRGGGFDGAIIFTVNTQSPLPAAMLVHFAGIPLRLAHCHENPYQLLTDWIQDPEPGALQRHEVARQLDLVAAIGCSAPDTSLSFEVPDEAREKLETTLPRPQMAGQPLVVVHGGASAASRRYPLSRYAEVVRRLACEQGAQVVLTGSCSERERVERLRTAARVPVLSMAGHLDIAELGALLERADLLISNNTGPVHLAAAVGTPVVDIYAQTNPQHTPWQVPHRVLSGDVPCGGCLKSVCPVGNHACLRNVWPEAVVAAASELLREAVAR